MPARERGPACRPDLSWTPQLHGQTAEPAFRGPFTPISRTASSARFKEEKVRRPLAWQLAPRSSGRFFHDPFAHVLLSDIQLVICRVLDAGHRVPGRFAREDQLVEL